MVLVSFDEAEGLSMRRIGSVLVVCSLISLIWVSPAQSCWWGRCCWGRWAACSDPCCYSCYDPCCDPCAAESVPVCGPAEAVADVAVPSPAPIEGAEPAPPAPEPKSPEEIAQEVATKTAQEVATETAREVAAQTAKDEATKAAAAAAQKEVEQLRSEVQALEAKVNQLQSQPTPTPKTPPAPKTPSGAGPEVTPGEFQAPGQKPQEAPPTGAEETPETFQAPGGQMAPGSTQPAAPPEVDEGTFQAPGAAAPTNESSMLIIPPGTTYGNTRVWTDNTGRYHARARLAEVRSGQVRLRLEGGQFVTVPLERLSLRDLLFVWRSGWFGSPMLLTMADN
jgi:hypothetical protein